MSASTISHTGVTSPEINATAADPSIVPDTPALQLVPRRMSLWEHVADVEGIADLVDSLDAKGELTDELTEQLQMALCAAVAGTKTKVDRTASVLQVFETAEASAVEEATRLTKRAARFKRQREYLELTVLAVLDASKLDRIDGNTATLSRRKNPPKVVIDDEAAIPVDFLRWPEEAPPPDPEPDKKLIGVALKADPASVPGARLHQTYKLVRS